MTEERHRGGIGYKESGEPSAESGTEQSPEPGFDNRPDEHLARLRRAQKALERLDQRSGGGREVIQARAKSPRKGRSQVSNAESVVLAKATQVIGDKDEAMRWMGTPIRALGYVTPISLVGSPEGRQAVMVVLGRLEHGVL